MVVHMGFELGILVVLRTVLGDMVCWQGDSSSRASFLHCIRSMEHLEYRQPEGAQQTSARGLGIFLGIWPGAADIPSGYDCVQPFRCSEGDIRREAKINFSIQQCNGPIGALRERKLPDL